MSSVVGFAVLCSCSCSCVDHATFNIFRHVPMSPSVLRRVHRPQIHAAHQTHSTRTHPRYEERAEARKNLRAARRAVRSPPSTAAEKKAARKEREAAAVQDKAAQEADRKKRREQRRLQAEKAAQEIAEEEAYIIEATKVRAMCTHVSRGDCRAHVSRCECASAHTYLARELADEAATTPSDPSP